MMTPAEIAEFRKKWKEEQFETFRQNVVREFNDLIFHSPCRDAYCNRPQNFLGRLWMRYMCFSHGHYWCLTRQHCIHCGKKP